MYNLTTCGPHGVLESFEVTFFWKDPGMKAEEKYLFDTIAYNLPAGVGV